MGLLFLVPRPLPKHHLPLPSPAYHPTLDRSSRTILSLLDSFTTAPPRAPGPSLACYVTLNEKSSSSDDGEQDYQSNHDSCETARVDEDGVSRNPGRTGNRDLDFMRVAGEKDRRYNVTPRLGEAFADGDVMVETTAQG